STHNYADLEYGVSGGADASVRSQVWIHNISYLKKLDPNQANFEILLVVADASDAAGSMFGKNETAEHFDAGHYKDETFLHDSTGLRCGCGRSIPVGGTSSPVPIHRDHLR
ncbi:MAG: hypothetical protein QGD90_12500, partial [Candidatus Hydrogenedentes bacterium]|nr:hypothetical protein [Candidatus Hydrogenedentota bacterium]